VPVQVGRPSLRLHSYPTNVFIQADLQTASHLLQTKPCLRVLILEQSSVSDARIRDVKLAEGLEMTGLGAWRVDGSVKMTSELLRSHGVKL